MVARFHQKGPLTMIKNFRFYRFAGWSRRDAIINAFADFRKVAW